MRALDLADRRYWLCDVTGAEDGRASAMVATTVATGGDGEVTRGGDVEVATAVTARVATAVTAVTARVAAAVAGSRGSWSELAPSGRAPTRSAATRAGHRPK
jgi:hypothetical protein